MRDRYKAGGLAALALALVGACGWWAFRAGAGDERPRVAALAPLQVEPAQRAADPAAQAFVPSEAERAEKREEATRRSAAGDAPRDPASRETAPSQTAPSGSIWLAGRVVLRDGTPVDETVRVEARGRRFRAGIGGRSHFGEAQHDGRFRVAFAEGTDKGFVQLSARYHYLEGNVTVVVDDAPKELLLEPKLGGVVRGKLLLPLTLSLEPPSFEGTVAALMSWSMDTYYHRTTAVDAEGGFEFGGIPPGGDFRLQIESKQYVDATREAVEVRPGEVTDVELELIRGVRLRGRVVGTDGEDVSGAKLLTTTPGVYRRSNGMGRLEPDGSFDLTGVAPGEIGLQVTCDGYLPLSMELGTLADGELREGILLRLARGNAIEGIVLWPDGEPAAGAWVQIAQERETVVWNITGADESRQRAGADGRFRFSGLEEAPCELRASARGEPVPDASGRRRRPNLVARARDVAPRTSGLRLVLGLGEGLSGRVVDDLGQPLARFFVSAKPASGEALGGVVGKSFTTEDGRFELQGLSDGDWQVSAKAKGHAESVPQGLTMPWSGPELVLTLPRLARVSGRVLTPSGEAAPGAHVSITSVDNRIIYANSYAPDSVKTDDQGLFESDAVVPGKRRIEAAAVGYATSVAFEIDVPVGGELTGLVLTLRRPARITGMVHPAAGEIAGREVTAQRTGGGFYSQQNTRSDGTFAFEGLAPGSYELALQPERARQQSGEVDWVLHHAQRQEAKVDLTEGGSAHVLLGEPPGRVIVVTGRLTEAGQAVADRTIAWMNGPHGAGAGTRSAGDGSYQVSLSRPGTWNVSVGNDWSDRFPLRVEVPDADSFRFDIALPTGSISGTVRGPGGQALPNCPVSIRGGPMEGAEGPGWRDSRNTETDAEGRYSFGNLRAGVYAIEAGGMGSRHNSTSVVHGRSRVSDIELAASEQRGRVDFALELGGTLEGTILDAAGRGVGGCWLELRDESGHEMRSWYGPGSDESGRFRYPGLAPGNVRVRARHGQRASNEVTVRIVAEQTARVELLMAD